MQYDDLTDLKNHLGDALCSREVPAVNPATAVSAITQAARSRLSISKPTHNADPALCVAGVTHIASN